MPETNNSYDMQRLQQDAIRRAREMQARAQNAVASSPPASRPAPAPGRTSIPVPGSVPVRHAPPEEQHTPLEEHAPPVEEPPQPGEHSAQAGHKATLPGPIGDIFDSLMADSERTLILILLLILMEEKADSGVIMALMYLVL